MTSLFRSALALILFSASLSLAQEPQETPTISMEVKRVVLYVTVREGKARFVGDLEKQNFTILEDGAAQEIISFSRMDVPVAIGLLIDNSQSMMNKKGEVIAAAKAFVRASKPEDDIFIIHFNEELNYGLPKNIPFTGDQKLLDQGIERMRQVGKTALYDAIFEGLKHLKESKLTKKALMVISDGGDNASFHKDADVVREADLSGALFYGIGIYDPMDGDANPGLLRKIAQNTGGETYFPKEVPEVRGLCETIARDLRSQYMLSYAPPEKSANDYRRVRVQIKDPQHRKLIVRTRTGYYAKPPAESGAKNE